MREPLVIDVPETFFNETERRQSAKLVLDAVRDAVWSRVTSREAV
jgi:hypothetical protein